MSRPSGHYFPFGPVRGVRLISLHAQNRFAERFSKGATVGQQMQRMEALIECGKEAFLKPEKRLNKLLNHGVQDARYYLKGSLQQGMIFVVANGVLITVHAANADEFTLTDNKGVAK